MQKTSSSLEHSMNEPKLVIIALTNTKISSETDYIGHRRMVGIKKDTYQNTNRSLTMKKHGTCLN